VATQAGLRSAFAIAVANASAERGAVSTVKGAELPRRRTRKTG
jgi:hypothetical protein